MGVWGRNKLGATAIAAGALLVSFASAADAAQLTNGSFDAGLAGWYDASATGTVTAQDGVAVLEGGFGADPYAAVLVQGDDGFFSFSDPLNLADTVLTVEFDFWRIDAAQDAAEEAGVFTDSLSFNIYDAVDSGFDLYFGELALAATPTRYAFDIRVLAGRDVALSFELNDVDDGFNTRFAIDNVALTFQNLAQVPEPGTWALLSLALAGYGLRRRNNR